MELVMMKTPPSSFDLKVGNASLRRALEGHGQHLDQTDIL